MTIVLSLDLDGTLETGAPPGPFTLDMVRLAKKRGMVVGSASDRTVAHQRAMWERADIPVDFVGHKHQLADLIRPFDAARLVHIGDSDADRHYSLLAGLEFVHVDDLPPVGTPGWIL